MTMYPDENRTRPLDLDYAVGERSVAGFFNTVYAWMSAGLALTAVVAWWVSTQPQLALKVLSGPALIVLFLVQIGLVIAISSAIRKITAPVATLLFLLYSGLNGLLFAGVFLAYTGASIASTFLVTAGTFAAFSIYGYVTKADLSRFGSILFMLLIGLVIASLVNMFWANSTLYWIVTYAGVFIFVGLTAYDTQKLKQIAMQTANDANMSARMSIYGALVLYLDFINLFLLLLRIMGSRK